LTYPRVSRELGEQGSVLLRVLVDERGRPTDIQVVKSSGYPRLDQQAVQAMRAARFKPHVEDGVARPMWVRTPQTFILEDN
jgi:protein TonB